MTFIQDHKWFKMRRNPAHGCFLKYFLLRTVSHSLCDEVTGPLGDSVPVYPLLYLSGLCTLPFPPSWSLRTALANMVEHTALKEQKSPGISWGMEVSSEVKVLADVVSGKGSTEGL